MKKTILALTVFMPLMASAGSQSKIDVINEKVKTCVGDSPSTVVMKECANQGLVESDLLLNEVYKKIVQTLDAPVHDQWTREANVETKRRLILAQRAWIQFRDANALLIGTGSLGGTLEGLEILGSRTDSTQARILELEKLFN
jgi:uncharacterized protein YecT (DUF1311 family)